MTFAIYGQRFYSRLILGTAGYPSLAIMQQALEAAQCELITVSLKRQAFDSSQANPFWERILNSGCQVLPNTAGCRSAAEALTTARLGRELFQTTRVKLEVIGDDHTLQPAVIELVKAAEWLIAEGFQVWPYCTDDITVCRALVEAGCEVLMPLAAPIGSGQGLLNEYGLRLLRNRFADIPLIVDAGIGTPSDAVKAMEMGMDAVLLNSAIAQAQDPAMMACAFARGVEAGRLAYQARRMPVRDLAHSATPLEDTPFWQQPTTLTGE